MSEKILTDNHAEAICKTIAKGYASGGFPIIDNELVGWYYWLRFQVKEPLRAYDQFAALAEHLGCKPEDLNVDLVEMWKALEFYGDMQNYQEYAPDKDVPTLISLDGGSCARRATHDTVDRADIGHEE